mgnify:CR=1 FL=1
MAEADIMLPYVEAVAALARKVEVTDSERAIVPLERAAHRAIDLILRLKDEGRKVLLIGNGGSAAIASHTHNDLCKAVGVRAMVFVESPLLTALSNDHGYDCVFERPVELWAAAGDLMIAISSSGRSENILRAVRVSRGRGCGIITFSGFQTDNPLRRLGDLNFYVPSPVYGHVELVHSVLAHFLTDYAASADADGVRSAAHTARGGDAEGRGRS